VRPPVPLLCIRSTEPRCAGSVEEEHLSLAIGLPISITRRCPRSLSLPGEARRVTKFEVHNLLEYEFRVQVALSLAITSPRPDRELA
jgi:hypothetical protein